MVFLKEFFKNVDFEKNLKCHLLITSANNLDPDLADKKQNVGLIRIQTVRYSESLMVFLEEIFKKVDFEINS